MQTVTLHFRIGRRFDSQRLEFPKEVVDGLGIDEGAWLTGAELRAAVAATWELAVAASNLALLNAKEMGPEGTETETEPPWFMSACPPQAPDHPKWKPHDGGESPVHPNIAVRFPVWVKLRGVSDPVTGHADEFLWPRRNEIGDVTHWRFPGPL